MLKFRPRHLSYDKKALANTVCLRTTERRLAKDQDVADRVLDELSSNPDLYLRFDRGLFA